MTISVGVACHPEDAIDKETLVETADQALFLAKGAPFRGSRDQFVAALDETAMGLLDGIGAGGAARLDPQSRGAPARRPHRLRLPGRARRRAHHRAAPASATWPSYVGFQLPVGQGVGGQVFRTGQPFVVDDYDTFEGALPEFKGKVGACVGVPLTVGGRVVGVLGLASGTTDRVFRQPEVEALHEVRAAGLDRARERPAPGAGALAARPGDRPADPRDAHPAHRRRAVAAAGRARLRDRSRSCSSTSTGSRSSTRASVTPPATASCARSAARITAVLGPDDTVARLVGTRSACCSRPRLRTGRWPSPTASSSSSSRRSTSTAARGSSARAWACRSALPGGTGAGDILQEAEIALVGAKRHPTRRAALFDPLSSRDARERLDVEAELWGALERDELTVHYQPILDLRTSRVVGFEALARWQHPSRGLVLPVDFIALAEESELIIAIGRVILEKACRQAQLWRQRWPDENLA